MRLASTRSSLPELTPAERRLDNAPPRLDDSSAAAEACAVSVLGFQGALHLLPAQRTKPCTTARDGAYSNGQLHARAW